MISANPTAAEKTQYAIYLGDAEAAYHRLMTGESEVSISYNGESVTYKQASLTQLRSYINDLRKALGKSTAVNRGLSFHPVVFGRR